MPPEPEPQRKKPPAPGPFPVVQPIGPGTRPAAGIPIVAPLAGPPVVQPIAGPAGTPPVVIPVVTPLPVPATAPAVAPVAAPAAARVEKHSRATDRVAGFTGMPLGLVVGLGVLVLSSLSGYFAWHVARHAADDSLARLDLLGTAAARVMAAPEFEWWRPDHGTAAEMRRRVEEGLERDKKEAGRIEDSRLREKRLTDLEEVRSKLVAAYLGDRKGVDDLLALRNQERLKKLRSGGDDPLLGAEVFDENRRALGRGPGVSSAETLATVNGTEVAAIAVSDGKGGVVHGRRYLRPVEGRDLGAGGSPVVTGYVGVYLSAEPALRAARAAEDAAMVVLLLACGSGLAAAAFAVTALLPLRRVLRDAEEFSRGNFDHRPSPLPGGEIGAVGRAVSRTALAARDREAEALAKAAAAVPPPPDHRPVVTAALAPAAPLKIPNWEVEGTSRPSLEIAGDTFDFVSGDAGHFAAILLETTVRGLPAAFLALEVRTLFRALALSGLRSPKTILEHLGAEAGPRLPQGAKVSALCVVVDVGTGAAVLASADGCDPVAWRAQGRAVETVPLPQGPALAATGGPGTGGEVAETSVALAPGDRLVLFTDGLSKAKNSRRESFGDVRFADLVKKFGPMNSTAFVNMVVNDVDLFHEGAAQRDDLTVLTIRRLR